MYFSPVIPARLRATVKLHPATSAGTYMAPITGTGKEVWQIPPEKPYAVFTSVSKMKGRLRMCCNFTSCQTYVLQSRARYDTCRNFFKTPYQPEIVTSPLMACKASGSYPSATADRKKPCM